MRSFELKILIPFLIIIILSLATVGIVSYYGSCKIFESITAQQSQEKFTVNSSYITNQLLELQKYTILIAIIAIIVASQLTIFFSYNLAKPIKKLAMACDEVSKGNFDIEIDYKKNDEIGILKDAFKRMTSKLKEYIAKVLEVTNLNQKIIDGVNYGIVVFNGKGAKILVNRSASSYIKKDTSFNRLIEKLIDDFFSGDIPPSGTQQFADREKSTKYVEYEINSFEDIFILCFSDITEKEKIKQKMEHINRLASIGEMSAAIAHEVRNPLQGIQSCFQVLQAKFPEDDGTSAKLFDLIYREIERINGIISNLLNFSRPSEPEPVMLSLKGVLNEILPFLSPLMKKKGLSLNISIDHGAEYLYVDKAHLKQMLLNLLTNSIRASHINGEIDILSSAAAGEIVITVRDRGRGIPEKNLEKIFTPFFSTFEGGTGLGLCVVQSLVFKNRGRIWIESRENNGTSVYIAFPCSFSHITSDAVDNTRN
ncbi:sensor histidine kinase [Thermoanaerobacterium sp. DL9XJH110]|uniref:sensor histidine kinase n=1 Tax=Thermoanaerobacterium sp. DL9XJH110 TaxID=3386643 RepID=UPI003BB49374